MRRYNIEGPDGEIYTIEGPDDATDDELIAALQRDLAAQSAPIFGTQSTTSAGPSPEELYERDLAAALEKKKQAELDDQGMFESLAKGASEGFTSTGASVVEGGASLLLDEQGEKSVERQLDRFRDATTYDVADRDSLSYLLGSGLGSIAGFLAPAAAVALGAPALGAGAGVTSAIGLGVGAAMGVGAGVGEASSRARAFGATKEEEEQAERLGGLVGATEVIPFVRFLNKLPGVNKVLQRVLVNGPTDTLRKKARSALSTGGLEAAQEFGAALAQNAIEQGYNPEADFFNEEAIKEAQAGGMAGAVFQGAIDFLQGRKGRTSRSQDELARLAEDPNLQPDAMTDQDEEVQAQQRTPTPLPANLTQGELFTGQDLGTRQDPPAGTVEETVALERMLDEEQDAEARADIQRRLDESNMRIRDEQQFNEVVRENQRAELELEAARKDSRQQSLALDAAETDSEGGADVRARRDGRPDSGRRDPVPTSPVAEESRRSTEDGVLELEQAARAERVPESTTEAGARRLDRPELLPRRDNVRQGQLDDTLDQPVAAAETDRDTFDPAELVQRLAADRERARVPEPVGADLTTPQTVTPSPELQESTMSGQEVIERITKAKANAQVAAAKKAQKAAKAAPVPVTKAKVAQPKVTAAAKKKAAKAAQAKVDKAARQTTAQALKDEVKALNKISKRAKVEKAVAPTEVRAESSKLEFYTQPKLGPASVEDTDKVISLVKTKLKKQRSKKQETPEAAQERDAQKYFSTHESANDALEAIAHESIFGNDQEQTTAQDSPGARQYFAGKGKQAANNAKEWVRKNLSPEANKTLDELVEQQEESFSDQKRKESTRRDKVAEQRKIEAKKAKEYAKEVQKDLKEFNARFTGADFRETLSDLDDLDFLPDFLDADAIMALDTPVHPTIKKLLEAGELGEALAALSATSPDPNVRKIASKLQKYVGDTKVEVTGLIRMPNGKLGAGMFDPKTNTITLDAEIGMNPHTILHEMVHAATNATLANKSHPITKQLTKLFNEVKDVLDTYYGAQSVDEFVAEAMTNPEFQAKLGGIHPDGKPISALQRFLNTLTNFVRNLVGLDSKKIGSAQDKFDGLVDGLLAVSPETRNAGLLYMAGTPDGISQIAQQGVASSETGKFLGGVQSGRGTKPANKLLDIFLTSNTKIKNLAMGLVGTKSMGDIANLVGLGNIGARIHKAIEEQRGAINDSDKVVNDFIREKWAPWAKANPTKKTALDRVIYNGKYGATLYQVDPQRARSNYENKDGTPRIDKDGNNLAEIWDMQRRDWDALGADGKKMYQQIRELYSKQYAELKSVIFGEIDSMTKDMQDGKARAKKLKNDIFARLFASGSLEVYFPLVREGQYTLKVINKAAQSPEESYAFFAYTSISERDAFARELRKDPNLTVETEDTQTSKFFEQTPPSSFVRQTFELLDSTNVDPIVKERFMRLFVDTLPETSFAKSLQKRKGTAGFIEDTGLALQTKAYDIGRQAVKLKYGVTFRELQKELEGIKPTDPPAAGMKGFKQKLAADVQNVKVELTNRLDFARNGAKNKQREPFVKGANQLAFLYTIGFNTSSAIINLSQIPLFAAPYMAARHGMDDTIGAISEATNMSKLVVGLPKQRRIFGNKDKPEQVDEYFDVDKDGNYTLKEGLDYLTNEEKQILKAYTPIIKAAAERGYLARSFLLDNLGLDESARAKGLADKTVELSAFGFNIVEKFNRQTILFANYRLLRKEIDTKPRIFSEVEGKYINTNDLTTAQKNELATSEAIYQAEQLNGGLALETAPRLSQEGLGRIALMYKSYGLNMYYTMFKSALRAIDYSSTGDPELRALARKQLVSMHGAALFFAGVHGLPLYGVISSLYDLMFTEDDEEDFDTIVRKSIGEGWYKGALNQLTGVDIASRAKLTDLVVQENRYNEDASLEETIGFYFGGPFLSTLGRGVRAGNDLLNGDIERGIEGFLPPAVANAYTSLVGRLQRDGAFKTRRGDIILDDITLTEHFGKFLGFTPARYNFEQERNRSLKGIERSILEQRTKLLRRFYMAIRAGSPYDRTKALKDIEKFNKKHAAKGAGIDSKTINKSIETHIKTSKNMHNGITLSPMLRASLLQYSREWE